MADVVGKRLRKEMRKLTDNREKMALAASLFQSAIREQLEGSFMAGCLEEGRMQCTVSTQVIFANFLDFIKKYPDDSGILEKAIDHYAEREFAMLAALLLSNRSLRPVDKAPAQ